MNREIKFRGWDSEGNMVYFDLVDIFNHNINGVCCAFKNLIIMQYIGIEDKNGKKIFERDIIKNDDDISLVMFDKIGYDGEWNGLTGFGLDDWKMGDSFYELEYGFDPKEIIVIGNIYENPELYT